MKGETADAGAEGLKGEPGTPVCYIVDIDHIVLDNYLCYLRIQNKQKQYHCIFYNRELMAFQVKKQIKDPKESQVLTYVIFYYLLK